jgi:hypothetical protein
MDFDAEVRSNIQEVLDSVARSSMAELSLGAADMGPPSSSSQQQVPSCSRCTTDHSKQGQFCCQSTHECIQATFISHVASS